MPQVKSIEARIKALEGFSVRVVSETGADVRGDKVLRANYDRHTNQASRTLTVAAWRRLRFDTQFPGYHVEVLLGNGDVAAGGMQLATVRASYDK